VGKDPKTLNALLSGSWEGAICNMIATARRKGRPVATSRLLCSLAYCPRGSGVLEATHIFQFWCFWRTPKPRQIEIMDWHSTWDIINKELEVQKRLESNNIICRKCEIY